MGKPMGPPAQAAPRACGDARATLVLSIVGVGVMLLLGLSGFFSFPVAGRVRFVLGLL